MKNLGGQEFVGNALQNYGISIANNFFRIQSDELNDENIKRFGNVPIH